MTVMTLPTTTATARTAPTGRLRELLRTVRARATSRPAPPQPADAHTTALLTTTSEPWTARGVLTLALHDGIERRYLLDPRDFAATTSPHVAYDARVHAAYILASQGHRPEWLAPHLDLPLAATRAICARAERHGPNGPGHGSVDVPARTWSAGS
jgi:hypothetical protein